MTDIKQILETVVAAIDAEPELPGEMPPEMRNALIKALKECDEDFLVEALRILVRSTKANIKERVIKALAPDGSIAQRYGRLTGQCFTWEGDGTGKICWSIEAAKELIGNREPQVEMRPEHWMMALDANTLAHEIDADYAKGCDFNKPLIAVSSPAHNDVPGAMIIIDGWHRILGAILTSRIESMMVHLLSSDEEVSCRIQEMAR